jgi:hypothetical protein
MSLIIKKNTTFKIPRTPPISFLGLSLWLKADTGITLGISQIIISGFTGIYTGANGTYNYNYEENWWYHSGASYYINSSGNLIDDNDGTVIATNNNNFQGAWTPTNYFSTITLSNAGEDADQGLVVVNGVYTRSDAGGPFASFTASGGRSIDWDPNDGNFWETSGGYYRNYGPSLNVGDWQPEGGEEPVPTAVNSTSVRNVGSPTSTTVADLVTSWADQSGNARNATIDTLSIYTTIGGKSFINFVAGSRFTLSSVIWSDIEFIGTIFFVARFNSSSAGGSSVLLYQEGNNGNLFFIRGIGSTNNFYITKNDGTVVVSSNVLADNNTNYILATTFNASTASLYLNGASAGSGPISSSAGSPFNSFIGGYDTEQFNVAEVIVYNRVLTTEERQQVEVYLNAKYQIY